MSVADVSNYKAGRTAKVGREKIKRVIWYLHQQGFIRLTDRREESKQRFLKWHGKARYGDPNHFIKTEKKA